MPKIRIEVYYKEIDFPEKIDCTEFPKVKSSVRNDKNSWYSNINNIVINGGYITNNNPCGKYEFVFHTNEMNAMLLKLSIDKRPCIVED